MKPILIEVPYPINTERLLIRPPLPGDGAEINAAVLESFAELHEWLPWANKIPEVEDNEASAREAFANWILRRDLRVCLFDRLSGKLVGNSGLHCINWDLRSFEIGYWVRNACARQGYVTEAVTALSQYAFRQLQAQRVEIRCDSENSASKKIPERLGFTFEAKLHNDGLKPHSSIARDTLIYARFNDQGLPDVKASW